ncbi:leukemia inhibitory factor receptor isoform X1 [Channa argus]|uniref:leukemia inhibitory factor receptor isoform X1 n=1 Tax=Channa argus TaxID=215402 RepID=UPI003521B41E
MIHFRIFTISLLALCLILSEGHRGCCLVNVWQPPSPNITHLLAVGDKQSLMVRWLVYHCDLVGHINEVQISRTENHIITYAENVSVPADVTEYTWTWTSDLPLECVDHSVRIRQYCNQSVLSPWSSWTTNPGVQTEDKTKAFPSERVLREGASAMFCCVSPPGVNIIEMRIYDKAYPLISFGPRVTAIAVDKLTIPTTYIKMLILQFSDTKGRHGNVGNYVSFPPQKLRNLTCMTLDMINIICSWDTSRKRYKWDRSNQTQTLRIENTNQAPISCQELSCTFPAIPHLEEYNVRVVVQNQFGEETETHSFNISDRVSPVVDWARLSPQVTDATVSWTVQGNVTQLNLLCQVTTEPHSITELWCNSRCTVKLEHLLPNTQYFARVRCSTNGRVWGKWTEPRFFKTGLLVTLNLWRKIKQLSDPHSREITLLWTSDVPDFAKNQQYRVQWWQEGNNGTQSKDIGQTQMEVCIGPGQYTFMVQAVLLSGHSIPANITIPKMDNRVKVVEKQLSSHTVGGFNLTWAQQVSATCGYTVEWCIESSAHSCDLQWKKMPEGNNTLILPDRHFKDGHRYTFNIYECTKDGHKLLEIQSGYSQELQTVQSPSLIEPVQSTYSSVTLEWRYNEADPTHPAFIVGYLVTVQDTLPGPNANMLSVLVSDPQKKSVTIKDLEENHEYKLSLSALTNKGPGQAATVVIWTKIKFSAHLAKILTPIFLLLGCISLLWPQRKKLKNGVKEIFSYPAGMNIKISELDTILNETFDTVLSENVEECISCDIEIINSLSDTASLRDPEPMNALSFPVSHSPFSPSWMSLKADYCPQSATLLSDKADVGQVTFITNKSYIPSVVECVFEPQEVMLSETKSSFEPSDCPEESCIIECGYISKDTL